MNTLTFLRKILPSSGWYCASRRRIRKRDGAETFQNDPYATLEDLTKAVQNVSTMRADVWMAMGSFKEKETTDNKGTYFRRTQANVDMLRCLWLDVDVSTKLKDYQTREEARDAIIEFLTDAKLPTPIIVNSGNGFHLYWPLEHEYTLEEWRPKAEILKRIAISYGLKTDPQCTTDAARVLRPVGTFNYKDPNYPREVKAILEDHDEQTDEELFTYLVASYEARPNAPKTTLLDTPPADVADFPLLPVTTFPPQPKNAELIYKGCKQIRKAPFGSEPVWRGMLSVIRLCEDGREWCHELSKLDETQYDYTKTEQKLNTLAQQQGEGMPMLCSTFSSLVPELCVGCASLGRISSPITLGVAGHVLHAQPSALENSATTHAAVVETTIPTQVPIQLAGTEFLFPTETKTPTIVTDAISHRKFICVTPQQATAEQPVGVVYLQNVKKDVGGVETWEQKSTYICPQAVIPVAITYEINTLGNKEQYYWVEVIDAKGKRNTVMIAGAIFHDQGSLIKELGTAGVNIVDQTHYTVMATYMRAYIAQVKATHPEFQAYEHFGWSEDNTFLVGKRLFRLDNGQLVETPAHVAKKVGFSEIIKSIHQVGDLEKWKDAFNVFAAPGMEHFAFGALTAFGAPLMKFTAHRGLMINLYNPASGQGKSACQKVAASVWGNPDKFMLHNVGSDSGDTYTSMMTTFVQLHSLPAIVEEITELPAEKVGSILLSIEGGNERRRGRGDGSIQSSGDWRTLILSSSNKAIRDKVAQAERAGDGTSRITRLLEIDVPDLNIEAGNQDWIRTKEKLDLVNENYGVAGIEFAKALVMNQHQLKSILEKEYMRLAQLVKGTQAERFWLSALSAIFVGARLSKAIGLHTYDVGRIEEWVLATIVPRSRKTMRDSKVNPSSVLGDILAAMAPGTVAVGKAVTATKDGDPLLAPVTVLKLPSAGAQVKVRYEVEKNRAYILRSALREWCRQNGMSFDETIKAFETAGVLLRARSNVDLGRGVKELVAMTIGRTDCVVVSTPKNMAGMLIKEPGEGIENED